MSSATSNHPYCDLALQYCDDVLAGKILASKQVHQAIKRHYDDLDSIADPSFKFTFNVEKAERVCRFAEKMPHVKGRWAQNKRNRFVLEPWQCFFLTTLFGWIEKATGFRRFRECVLLLPRKNGKSFLASVISLYMLCADAEPGAEVYCAANSLEQAMTVFTPAKQMCERVKALQDHFEIEVNAKSLVVSDGSRMVPVVGVSREGQNAHLACLDEYHEADNDSLYNSLVQSMGARTQPLMLVISTAGTTIEGPCHKLQMECEEMLDGSLDRPELFALIFTVDKDLDWTNPDALRMANPNLGVSVNFDALSTEHRNAIRSAVKQNPFKTKKLNIWCNASTAFFNMAHWAECADPKLKPEDFKGKQCWMAADLSAKLDLTCVIKLFKDGNTYYCFPRLYLPEERAADPTLGMYARWVEAGALTATEGNVIDIDTIINETVADIETYQPLEFAFDKWHADFFTQQLQKRFPNLTLADVPTGTTQYLSPAMFEIEALMTARRIKHNNNPVANWCMSNVVSKPDPRGHVYPRKARNENKIDFAFTLMLAISRIAQKARPKGTSQIIWG